MAKRELPKSCHVLALCGAVLVHVAVLAWINFLLIPGAGAIAGPVFVLDFVSLGAAQAEAPPSASPGVGGPIASISQESPPCGQGGTERVPTAAAKPDHHVHRQTAKKNAKAVRPRPPVALPSETATYDKHRREEDASPLTQSPADTDARKTAETGSTETDSSAGNTEIAVVDPGHGGGGTPHGHGDKDGTARSGCEGQGGETRKFGDPEGPGIVRLVKPRYPQEARRLGKEGVVILKLSIDASGQIGDLEVTQAAGYGMDEAAKEAISRSRFRPATLNGFPVACRALLPLYFKLQ